MSKTLKYLPFILINYWFKDDQIYLTNKVRKKVDGFIYITLRYFESLKESVEVSLLYECVSKFYLIIDLIIVNSF